MPSIDQDEIRRQRWESEAKFFDNWAAHAREEVKAIDPAAVTRYSAARLRQRFQKEFRIGIVGNLEGKSVLDVGCGEGQNSVLLATLGARVTGIDVSPGAISIAKKHSQASGTAALTDFHCAPIESFESRKDWYDIIWCDSILHHLIPDLEPVMRKLTGYCSPTTLVVIYEPVNLCPLLRRIREKLPIHTDATDGERPLERREIDVIRRCLPDMKMRGFSLFGRFDRFILSKCNYERSSLPQRLLSSAAAAIDSGILQLPGLRELAGQAVMYGHSVPKAEHVPTAK